MPQEQMRDLMAPVANAETQPFWDAAADGVLMIKRCTACGQRHYYPRALCPFCLSSDTVWEASAGVGTLYSFAPMRRGKVPYTLAYVTLDEGPAVLTNVIGDPDALAIGRRMRIRFVATDGGPPVPMFEIEEE